VSLSHRCDDQCACPEHGTPLFYSPAAGDHACQDPGCVFAHGMSDALLLQWATARHGPVQAPVPEARGPRWPRDDDRYVRAFARIVGDRRGPDAIDRLIDAGRKGWITPEWATEMIKDVILWYPAATSTTSARPGARFPLDEAQART
jgi:hypothetical protein